MQPPCRFNTRGVPGMRPRRFRFKLATLLIAIAVVALALAVIVPLWNRPPAVDPFDAAEMFGPDKTPTK